MGCSAFDLRTLRLDAGVGWCAVYLLVGAFGFITGVVLIQRF